MNSAMLIDPFFLVSGPPRGSVNVRSGKPVEGPGGRWVPCATAITGGVYAASVFQVGPGHKQVCVMNHQTHSIKEALLLATHLADIAAA